MNIIAIKQLP